MTAFMRIIEVIAAGKTLRYPELEIEFEINFTDDSEGNVGYISLYNLAQSTIDQFAEDMPVIVRAGYEGDVGTLLPGVVEKHYTRYEDVDRATEFIIGDHTDAWLSATVNRTWAAGQDAHSIAQDIINLLPFELGEFAPEENIEYEKGKTFSTTCKRALEEIAADIGAKLHVSRGQIFFRQPEKGTEDIVLLNSNTGLLSTPERGEKDGREIWDVRALLNYRIWADEVVRIESKSITGEYRVIDGRHLRSGADFITEMEVERYGA